MAQKPPLQISNLGTWPLLSEPILSNNGKFLSYTIRDKKEKKAIVYIQSTENRWTTKFEVRNVYANVSFLYNSQSAIIQISPDSICFVKLGDTTRSYIKAFAYQSYLVGKEQYVIFKLGGSLNSIMIKDVRMNSNSVIDSVEEYHVLNNGLLLIEKRSSGNRNRFSILTHDFRSGKTMNVWYGKNAKNFVYSSSGNQIGFISTDTFVNGRIENSVLIFQCEKKKVRKIGDFVKGAGFLNYEISSIIKVFDDDEGILLSLSIADSISVVPVQSKNLRSYSDINLKPYQAKNVNTKKEYLFYYNWVNKKLIRIQGENETILSDINTDGADESCFLLRHVDGDGDNEWNWNRFAKSSVIFFSLKNNERKVVNRDLPGPLILSYKLSPSGRYVSFYDKDKKSYFSFNTETGVKANVTEGVNAKWTTLDRDDEPQSELLTLGYGGFVTNTEKVLIYDQHDIFLVNLDRQGDVVNITRSVGKANNISFSLALQKKQLHNDEDLLLSAFNNYTKEDGFYSCKLGSSSSPDKLVMEKCLFKGPMESDNLDNFVPVKASDAEVYIVRKTTSTSYPNYYLTRNFIDFVQISDLHPEREFNWICSQLIHFKNVDGKELSGILYKPENFDYNKKYPIIFYYYQRASEAINNYIFPDFSRGPINISYFVSNGYLIFIPDIHYEIGKPGKSALNIVLSAATVLSKEKWIDKSKMGLQGHSFGGFETNYIITHTKYFAAAVSASSMSNFISCYGSILPDGTTRQRQYELYKDRIGASLWERPDLYLENSPVLLANKVSTPLLMMNNPKDGDVPYSQGIEFFTGLRRLGKKVWMLSYENSGHVVFGKESLDYTIKMKEFFDYYLKGLPPPVWLNDKISITYE